MLLKNKETGRIETFEAAWHLKHYTSLKDFCRDWEDAPEEPKEYWYIDSYGTAIQAVYYDNEWHELRKQIGNYFETKEEAEQAVERLRAWKRLKDKKYRFSRWFTRVEGGIQINMEYNKYDGIDSECRNDLDLLFCAEENS